MTQMITFKPLQAWHNLPSGEAQLLWIEQHGPVPPGEARVPCDIPGMLAVRAGGAPKPDGSVTLSSQALQVLKKEAERLFVETGKVPEELPGARVRELMLEVLQKQEEERAASKARQQELTKMQEADRKEADRKEKMRVRWVYKYGSARLRKAFDLGLLEQSPGIFRDEYLTKEFPKWEWEEEEDQILDVINPSETALVKLEDTRAQHPEAELVYVRRRLDDFKYTKFPAVRIPVLDSHALLRVPAR